MRVLVTGGAGFIGSRLVPVLVGRGHSVTVLDDYSSGRTKQPESVKSLFGSVTDPRIVDEAVSESDCVVHLAFKVGVERVVNDPVAMFVDAPKAMTLVCRAAASGGKPLIFASSSEVYGRGSGRVMVEDGDRIFGPIEEKRWSYGVAKGACESIGSFYAETHGFPFLAVRFFNCAGPGQDWSRGFVIPSMVRAAVTGQPIVVHGDGTQARCFCHVDDVAEGVVRLAEKGRWSVGALNIGTQRLISIADLAKLVKSICGSKSEIVHGPADRDLGKGFSEVPVRIPSLARLQFELGWLPRRTLEEIISDVALDLRQGVL